MKTAVTIPWEAVVEGCPPSEKAKELPLVVAERCALRGEYDLVDSVRALTQALSRDVTGARAVGRRSSVSARVEFLFSGGWENAVAILTSDGTSRVMLQGIRPNWSRMDTDDPELATDALVRAYVLRYARLDADLCALIPTGADEDHTAAEPMRFIRPENWGFGPTRDKARWRSPVVGRSSSKRHVPNRHCSSTQVLRPPHETQFDEPTPERGDPLDCLSLLNHVRAQLETKLCTATPEHHAESLCYLPALALGRCRLFGVKISVADDFALGPVAFAHAAKHMIGRLKYAAGTADLADGQIEIGGAYAQEHLALELLEARMDAHAAYLALDEAYAAALYEGSPEVPAMSRRLTQVRRLINLFDGNLQKNLPLLRLAASTYLLDNWRRLLAPAYRDCPPWWLDGCIG